MNSPSRIRIAPRAAMAMVWHYAKTRVMEQIRSVAFILLYLVGFQMLVLGSTPTHALRVAGGVALVVLGLTFFLEGLILGLMPLGERVGVGLPRRCGIGAIGVFGLLLGMGSTYAEPAISALRAAGSMVTAWDSPLLYFLLNRHPQFLVLAIAVGVGVAVAFGMIRFYYGLSIKPFVYVLIPLLLGVSGYCALDANLGSILGLAWDAGAVTTGAVTVPLVLALGIGVSRASGRQEDAGGGFGIIMLASSFPVLAVLLLGIAMNAGLPSPQSEAEFLQPKNRVQALKLFASEQELQAHALRLGGEAAQTAYADAAAEEAIPAEAAEVPFDTIFAKESLAALRAVIPLTALLLVVLALLRDRPRHMDEVGLGIALALVGVALLTTGIRTGLAPLGDQIGRPLPRVFRSTPAEEGRLVLPSFDPEAVFAVFTAAGGPERFFYLRQAGREPQAVRYEPSRYDSATGSYEHVLERSPMFGARLTFAGILLVFLFAFGLGYGATLAEPALSALGRTVEELSVGTIRRASVVRAVSIGVGVGLMFGVARLLYNIPTIWLLLPPYLLLLPLTFWSEEDFAGIAWDCGGVTTGGITVPLVLAMGLGIGGELNISDGFGLLAMASAYPIASVLLFGLVVRSRQRRRIRAAKREDEDG